jgi:hypothetical protein
MKDVRLGCEDLEPDWKAVLGRASSECFRFWSRSISWGRLHKQRW